MAKARLAKKKIRVLVADREGVFRIGLTRLLAVEDDLRVVGEADDAKELLAKAEVFQPDLIFLQEEIVAESGTDLISALHGSARQCKIVTTASSTSSELAMHHIRSGASGIILKSDDPELFVTCARRVSAGETWVPKRQVSHVACLVPRQPPRPADTLTRREKVIISYLMQGWRNRQISDHLSISEQTVKNHLRTIYDKVGVSDRLELVLYAIHQRMELPPCKPLIHPSEMEE